MPVLAHAEKDHIEARDFTSLEMKFFAQQFLVLKGGFHGVLIAAHTEKLGAGNVVQELAAGNAVIAQGVVGADTTLIGPENGNLIPGQSVDPVLAGKKAEEGDRRFAAGDGNLELPALRNGLVAGFGDDVCRAFSHGVGVFMDMEGKVD